MLQKRGKFKESNLFKAIIKKQNQSESEDQYFFGRLRSMLRNLPFQIISLRTGATNFVARRLTQESRFLF